MNRISNEERRTQVQGDGAHWCRPAHEVWRETPPPRKPGSISWAEHLEAHVDYERRYPDLQSAEEIAKRGGFGYYELMFHLGHEPTTWKEKK